MGAQRKNKLRLALGASTAVGLLGGFIGVAGAGTASASPVSLSLNYTCTYPLIGAKPLKLVINSDIPSTLPVNTQTGQFNINATATVSADTTTGLALVGAKTLEGTATADVNVSQAESNLNLDLKVPNAVTKTNVPDSGAFDVPATGVTPSLSFTKAGKATITVGDLLLHLAPKDANGQLTGLGEFDSSCTEDTGQNNVLTTVTVTDSGGTTGSTTSGTTGTTTAGTTGSTTSGTTGSTTSGTTGSTSAGTTGSTTSGTTGSTTSGTTGGTTPPPIPYKFNLDGSSVIKAAQGTVPLKGGINALFDLSTGKYTADLTLSPTTGTFSIFGFLPATAQVAFQPVGTTTGTMGGGKLTTSSQMYVALPQVSVFGIPIGGGADCKTATPAQIDLASTDAYFDPLKGGKVAGTYTLPPLKGCGALNDTISGFTAGPGNTIAAKLIVPGAAATRR